MIDWSKHIVILDDKKKASFEQQILEFHNSKNDFEFQELQKSNRTLWETHLMRHSYFMKVHDMFLNKITDHA